MKNIIFGVVVSVILAAVGWYIYHSQKTASTSVATAGDSGAVPQAGGRPEQDAEPQSEKAVYEKPERVPADFMDFYEASQAKRLNMVTEVMEHRDPIDPETYAFLKAELFNREHWNVTRNNMANALVFAQDEQGKHPDPELHKTFIAMLEDETEDPIWRDYCLQFLSAIRGICSDPEKVKETIVKYSKTDGALAGTAIIHMALQEQEGQMKLDEEFNKQLVQQLESPDVHPDTKLAILGVMGRRKDYRRLPVIRNYAAQDEDAGLKRVAIAALGSMGESPGTASTITDDDKAMIRAALKHKNRAVQLAAMGALKRLGMTEAE